jgi:metal-responsive CopG/Arc/MetJ family transcriptional regulator
MKKLISISDNVAHNLEAHAKKNKSTQSKVVEVAISLYLASMKKPSNKGMRV